MNTAAEFLVNGLQLSLPEKLEQYIENNIDIICALTEKPISKGIPWKRVIPPSTSEYLDLLHGCTLPYMSIEAAAAYKGTANLGGRLIFEDAHYRPFIGIESANKNPDRPCWSNLVRDVWPERIGQRCLCIIADDFKKRVWPRARISALGKSTEVYLLYGERYVSQIQQISWPRLIEVLNLVENVYDAGFSKDAIHDGLYASYHNFTDNLEQSMNYESSLAEIRQLPEFLVALLIAQKGIKK